MIELLRSLSKQLSMSPSPRLDAEVLLAYVLNVRREELLCLNRTLTAKEKALLEKYLYKRKQGQPIQYITRKVEFYGFSFNIIEEVFIPRPETELLVTWALDHIKTNNRILDMGAGTGCIGLTLALMRPDIFVHAWEKSETALKILRQNYQKQKFPSNYSFEFFNITKSSLTIDHKNKYQVVISNPPYIGYSDKHIDPFVKKHEPHLALFSGPTGLECLDSWSYIAHAVLVENGMACFEIGFQQASCVIKIFQKNGFVDIKIIKDNNRLNRMVVAKRYK